MGVPPQREANMTVVTDEVLTEMVQTIVREVAPEQVYLFGSRARGDVCADSDVDLLIVEREPFGPEHSRFREINRIYQALLRFRVYKDIVLCSSDELARWRTSINHIVGTCQREGKLLYERS
jgi:predicted nucleotidyltransferase